MPDFAMHTVIGKYPRACSGGQHNSIGGQHNRNLELLPPRRLCSLISTAAYTMGGSHMKAPSPQSQPLSMLGYILCYSATHHAVRLACLSTEQQRMAGTGEGG